MLFSGGVNVEELSKRLKSRCNLGIVVHLELRSLNSSKEDVLPQLTRY